VEVVKYLFSQGANVNARNRDGVTLLHLAARNRNAQMANFLLSKGANVNAIDNFGATPLDRSITDENKTILLAAGGKSGFETIIAKLFSGWTIKNCALDLDYFGLQANYRGRRNVFRTHPPSRTVPCTLGYRTDIPANKKTVLKATVSNHPTRDWELVCRVNGKVQKTVTINDALTNNGWKTVEFDLTPFAGMKNIHLELENKANDWAWEDGYWADIFIQSK
jgi:ankyrin repeat protein